MAKLLTLQQAAKLGVWMVVSSVLLIGGPWYGGHLLDDPTATPTVRWAAVAISVASVLPWLAYVGWGISVADEFNRRTLIMTTAIAFVLAMLFSMTSLLLFDAHFIRYPVVANLPISFVIWMASGLLVLAYEKARGIR